MSSPESATPEPVRGALQPGWADEATVAARRKWQSHVSAFTHGVTEAILQAAEPRPGLRVLDLASGMGQPALLLAAAVGPAGHVTATDVEPGILAVAEETARNLGLANMSFRQADAQALPFADQTFDLITCRFGIMFFPDPVKALREALRVLKMGGRAAYTAWGSPDQPFYKATVGILRKHASVPAPSADTPHPFRFAEPGSLRNVMGSAGFRDVREELRTTPLIWPGPPQQLWEYFREAAAAFRPLIDALPAEKRDAVVNEILVALGQHSQGRQVRFPGVIMLATGMRG